jgi:hypothetical protein
MTTMKLMLPRRGAGLRPSGSIPELIHQLMIFDQLAPTDGPCQRGARDEGGPVDQ